MSKGESTDDPIRLPRGPSTLTSQEIWAALHASPGFDESQRQAMADFEAGRYYTLDFATGKTHPNPDWPKDGPQPSHD